MDLGSHGFRKGRRTQTFPSPRIDLSPSKEVKKVNVFASQSFLRIKSPTSAISLKSQCNGLFSNRHNRSQMELEISSPPAYPTHTRTGTEWNLSSPRLQSQPPKTKIPELSQGISELKTKIKSLEKANEELTTQLCTVTCRNLELCRCLETCEDRMKELINVFSELQMPVLPGEKSEPLDLESSLTFDKTSTRSQPSTYTPKPTDSPTRRKHVLHPDRFDLMNRTSDTSQRSIQKRTIKARGKDNYPELPIILEELQSKGELLRLKHCDILTFLQGERSMVSPMLQEVLMLTNFIARLKLLVTACEDGTLDTLVRDIRGTEVTRSISTLEEGHRLLKTAQKSMGEIEDQLISWYADLCGNRCSIC